MRYRRASPNSLDRKPYLGGCHDSPEPGRRFRRGGVEPQCGSLDAGRRAGFDRYRELYTLPAFLRFMPPVEKKRVIDLGCGEGSNTRRFAGLGGRMIGVDLSGELIARARQKEAEDPLGVEYCVGSFGDLASFADGQFDCAVSTMALMDGPDFSAAMRATHRVLKPGGTLCLACCIRASSRPRSGGSATSGAPTSGFRWAVISTRHPLSSTGGSASALTRNRSALRSATFPTHLVRLRQCADRGRLPDRRDRRTAAR